MTGITLSKKKEVVVKGRLIPCPKYNPKMIIDIESCEKCEYHQGIELAVPASKGSLVHPDIHEVICGIPTRIRVQYYVSEEES